MVKERTMDQLEHSIAVLQKGHIDTGLTGTYFMMKLLVEEKRNDLIFTMANKTTFPSYGYFLQQGFTTWPESWALTPGVSKMHGCYNAIGLWFIEGIAGITTNASDIHFPIHIRAGVESGDITWAKGTRSALYGQATSSWSIDQAHGFRHNITIPASAAARVLIPAAAPEHVTESGRHAVSAKGVTLLGTEQINGIGYVVLQVLSGDYYFSSAWMRKPLQQQQAT